MEVARSEIEHVRSAIERDGKSKKVVREIVVEELASEMRQLRIKEKKRGVTYRSDALESWSSPVRHRLTRAYQVPKVKVQEPVERLDELSLLLQLYLDSQANSYDRRKRQHWRLTMVPRSKVLQISRDRFEVNQELCRYRTDLFEMKEGSVRSKSGGFESCGRILSERVDSDPV